ATHRPNRRGTSSLGCAAAWIHEIGRGAVFTPAAFFRAQALRRRAPNPSAAGSVLRPSSMPRRHSLRLGAVRTRGGARCRWHWRQDLHVAIFGLAFGLNALAHRRPASLAQHALFGGHPASRLSDEFRRVEGDGPRSLWPE